jgi:hypothetical protein
MTVPLDKRRQSFNEALKRMTEDVGESYLTEISFEAKSDRFKDILETTWDELMSRGHIRYRWIDTYNLTVDGWVEGMILLDRQNDPTFKGKLGRFMACLKDQIKGRHEPEGYLNLEDAAAATGFSPVTIRNMLDGRYIERALGRVGAKLAADAVIEIPRNFGH